MGELEKLIMNLIKRAESDLKTARDEMNTEEPATDTVCFHAQQCAEKYLKAFLVLNQKHFKKIHNIAKLIELCKEIDNDFDKFYDFGADNLTVYAVEMRYGEEYYLPSIKEASESVEIAEKVKKFVLEKFKSRNFKI